MTGREAPRHREWLDGKSRLRLGPLCKWIDGTVGPIIGYVDWEARWATSLKM